MVRLNAARWQVACQCTRHFHASPALSTSTLTARLEKSWIILISSISSCNQREMASTQSPTKHPRARIALCAVVFFLAVTLGISIGYSERTPDFNPTASKASNYSAVNISRIVTNIDHLRPLPLICLEFSSPSRAI